MTVLTREALKEELQAICECLESFVQRQVAELPAKIKTELEGEVVGFPREFSRPAPPDGTSPKMPSVAVLNFDDDDVPSRHLMRFGTRSGRKCSTQSSVPTPLRSARKHSTPCPQLQGSFLGVPEEDQKDDCSDELDAWEANRMNSAGSIVTDEELELAVLSAASRPRLDTGNLRFAAREECCESKEITDSPFLPHDVYTHDLYERHAVRTEGTLHVNPVGARVNEFVAELDEELFSTEGHACDCACACVARLVHDWRFDYFFAFLVLMNAIIMGFDVDFVAGRQDSERGGSYHIISLIFLIVFSIELVLRITAEGKLFFTSIGRWKWNVFDVFVLCLQITEEIVSASLPAQSFRMNVTHLRLLRFFLIARTVRGVRILRLIKELRILFSTMVGSMKCLFWTIVLLAVTIYLFSIWFTYLVAQFKIEYGNEHPASVAQLDPYFGTMGSTCLSLFQAISGGIDWRELSNALHNEISPAMGMLFVAYIIFAVFALTNVVTGVFVDSGIKASKTDMDLFMQNNVRELFLEADGGMSAELTWDDFQLRLDQGQMREYFKAIDVDPSDAKAVWKLLDLDGSGTISAEEFLSGCLRLRGPAKAIDVALVLHEVRKIRRRLPSSAHTNGSSSTFDASFRQYGRCRTDLSMGASHLPWNRKNEAVGSSPASG